jgi:hypothetical protein
MLITLLKILFTPSKFCSHHLFSESHRNNCVHTINFQDHTVIILFTPWRCWSHSWKFCSHHLNFVHTIYFQGHTGIILFTPSRFYSHFGKCDRKSNAKIMNMWYKTCRHHTDLHCSHTVGMKNTHIRWNQVFVVWPSYVSVQNKFVWVWSPLMNAKMLHVRFVRPWWDSTAWTVEYSRIQFMHWYSWRDITPCHFSAVRLVGDLGLRRWGASSSQVYIQGVCESTLNSNLCTHGVPSKS